MKIEKIDITSKDREKIMPSVVFVAEKLNEVIDHLNQTEEKPHQMNERLYKENTDLIKKTGDWDFSTPQEVGDWEEEFDEKFGRVFKLNTTKDTRYNYLVEDITLDVKDFITTLLAKKGKESSDYYTGLTEATKKDIIRMIKEKGHQQEDDTIWCNMDDIINIINETL